MSSSTLNTVLKLRRSKDIGNVIDPDLLDSGELAINTADGVIFYKKADRTLGRLFDFDNYELRYLRLDGGNSPTANINFSGLNITTLADPVNNQDAATKNYVDASLAELGLTTFPIGDYGLLTETLNVDAFGIQLYSAFDCLTTPGESLQTEDLGVLT